MTGAVKLACTTESVSVTIYFPPRLTIGCQLVQRAHLVNNGAAQFIGRSTNIGQTLTYLYTEGEVVEI